MPSSDADGDVRYDEDGIQDENAGVFDASSSSSSGPSDSATQFSGSISSRMNAAGEAGMRDVWFLVAFVAHLVGLIAVAGVFGPAMVRDLENRSGNSGSATTANPGNSAFGQVIGILSVAALIGALFAAVWLRAIQRLQGRVVKYSLVGNAVIVVVALIAAFASGVWPLGVVFLVYIVILGVWCYSIRSRIPMAEATLAAASRSLLDNSGPIVVAYGTAVLLLLFSAFWAFTFTSVFWAANTVSPQSPGTGVQPTEQTDPVSPGMKAAFVFLIFSLYWTAQVLANISHVTTAGMVASWWLCNDIERPTVGALKRAWTTSLGTICAASLVVAIIQTVVYLLRQSRGILARIAQFLLELINDVVRWFNKYALVETAMYGYVRSHPQHSSDSLQSAHTVPCSLCAMVRWLWQVHVLGQRACGEVPDGRQLLAAAHQRQPAQRGVPHGQHDGRRTGWAGGRRVGGVHQHPAERRHRTARLRHRLHPLLPLHDRHLLGGGHHVSAAHITLCRSSSSPCPAVATVAHPHRVRALLLWRRYVVWAEDPSAMLRNRPDHYAKIAAAAQGRYPTEYAEAVGSRVGPQAAEMGQAQQPQQVVY